MFRSLVRRLIRRIRDRLYPPAIWIQEPKAVYRSTTQTVDLSYREWCVANFADEAFELIPLD